MIDSGYEETIVAILAAFCQKARGCFVEISDVMGSLISELALVKAPKSGFSARRPMSRESVRPLLPHANGMIVGQARSSIGGLATA